MFRLHVKDLPGYLENYHEYLDGVRSELGQAQLCFCLHHSGHIPPAGHLTADARCSQRDYHNPATFDAICDRYACTYARFGWKAKVDTMQRGGAFYLDECDAVGRRTYHLVCRVAGCDVGPVPSLYCCPFQLLLSFGTECHLSSFPGSLCVGR